MDRIMESFERNKKWMYFAIIATFVWGFVTHGYSFVDNNFSHDSLNEFHGAIWGNHLKMGSGRVFVPIYRDLFRGDLTMPWLIGILALLWIGLAVFLTIRIFSIENKLLIVLTAGIFTANISVSATAATYIHDLDCNMFSMLCAVAAVYCWKKLPWGSVLGALFLMVSLGIYQGFLAVTIVLVLFVCILALMNGDTFKNVFRQGLKAVGMILAGCGLYYVAMRVILHLSNLQLTSGDYNSLDVILRLTPKTLVEMIAGAYQDCFMRLINAYSAYPAIAIKAITLVLLLIFAGVTVIRLGNKSMGIPEKVLCICLIGLLPVGMDLLYILTLGQNHDLMVYAIWLFYLLALLLTDWLAARPCGGKVQIGKLLHVFTILLVFLLLFGHVQFANGMYMKKEQEYDAYLSLMTRIVDDMEECEEYVPGETPVVFVGLPDNLIDMIPGFKDYWNVIGMISTDVILRPQRDRYRAYFENVMGLPIVLAEDSVWDDIWSRDSVIEMPPYPSKECIAMIDGNLVVKLGTVSNEE